MTNQPISKKSKSLKTFLADNMVVLLFLTLSLGGLFLSGMRMNALVYELMGRITRNLFLILALLIPIVAGMGINFAITIGAMAAQIAMLLVLNWKIPGIGGVALAGVIAIPIAALFGNLVGRVLNKMKGQEMIGSMVLGYFANGLYQLLFLYIFGSIIPIKNPDLLIVGSTGIRNTLDLSVSYGFKGALDKSFEQLLEKIFGVAIKIDFALGLYIGCAIGAITLLLLFFIKKRSLKTLVPIVFMGLAVAVMQIPAVNSVFKTIRSIPITTFVFIGLLCLFNVSIMRTKLGQQFKAVGQNQAVANAAGINVNKTRIKAITLSTVLAALGQIIFIQNFGQLQTYSAHEQVGLYAGAAILVGGASNKKATNGQAILGCVMFHILFIVAPGAGQKLFGDANTGENFRAFISYGAIALALVLHGLKDHKKSPSQLLQNAGSKA